MGGARGRGREDVRVEVQEVQAGGGARRNAGWKARAHRGGGPRARSCARQVRAQQQPAAAAVLYVWAWWSMTRAKDGIQGGSSERRGACAQIHAAQRRARRKLGARAVRPVHGCSAVWGAGGAAKALCAPGGAQAHRMGGSTGQAGAARRLSPRAQRLGAFKCRWVRARAAWCRALNSAFNQPKE